MLLPPPSPRPARRSPVAIILAMVLATALVLVVAAVALVVIAREPDPSAVSAKEAGLESARALTGSEWTLLESRAVEIDERAGSCYVEGWRTGAVDRHLVVLGEVGALATDQIYIELAEYETEALMAADIERSRSEEYGDCESGGDPPAELLPDDPAAPGAGWEVPASPPFSLVPEHSYNIGVGVVRAKVTFCGCSRLRLDDRRQIFRAVAAALAEAQALPPPGAGG